MRRVWYLPDFWSDVEVSRQWYDEQRPGLGAEFIAAVYDAIAKVVERPESYRAATRKTRRCIVSRFRHLLFFEATPEVILILGVVHSSRNVRRWLQERKR